MKSFLLVAAAALWLLGCGDEQDLEPEDTTMWTYGWTNSAATNTAPTPGSN